MSNNFSQPEHTQHNQNNSQAQPKRHTGLLGSYAEQQATQQRPQAQQWQGPAFMARPAQMVQRWSNKMGALRHQGPPVQQMMQRWTNKMAALRKPALPVNPNPLVRYRAPQMPAPMGVRSDRPVPTSPEPWRRSRASKITHMIRKRRERSTPANNRLGSIIASVLIALVVILLASGTISTYTYYESQLPQVQGLANMQISQESRIYDRNGKLLYTLYNQVYGRSAPVSYNNIPGIMQDAQVAAEDKTFWTNNGVDPNAILRSAFIDANAGQAQTGASTLTQQVIKNLLNNEPQNIGKSPDRSPQRKISEAALAIGLTQQYPKQKIMEMYLNIAPYGAQEQGVEAAAQDFFGLKPMCDAHFNCTPAIAFLDRDLKNCKNPGDETTCAVDPILGLARASLMAAIPQNPVTYDPLTNSDNYQLLLQRQDYVLKQMMADGMSINLGLGSQTQNASSITPQVIQQAETVAKNINFSGFQGGNAAPHFVRWVIQTLATSLGNGDYSTGLTTLENSGLNIRTTLDSNLETYVEKAEYRHINQPEVQPFMGPYSQTLSKSDNLHDSATVVMDSKTGEVLAMDGSINWNDNSKAGSGQLNMALSPRQPGSAFKPIVLAAAYEMGMYPGIVLPDYKTYFPQGESQNLPAQSSTYTPKDYGNTYHNQPTNIAQAIANSYNIPALKMQNFAGRQNVYNMAVRLGITSIDPKTGLVPSMALGTNAVPLLQMVGAYQTFANQGTHIPPQNILDIWDNYGHDLYHFDPSHPAGANVLSPQIAYLVTSTLDNETLRYPEFQNDHVLSMWDWTLSDGTHPDVATKTGTTDSFKDNLTIGYTPDVVVGVWSGNANDAAMVNSIGVTGAAPIWHSIIEYVSGKCNTASDQIPCPQLDFHYADRHFTRPNGIVQQPVNTYNGLQGYGYTSYMLNGEQPQQSGYIASCSNTGNNGKKGWKGCNSNGN